MHRKRKGEITQVERCMVDEKTVGICEYSRAVDYGKNVIDDRDIRIAARGRRDRPVRGGESAGPRRVRRDKRMNERVMERAVIAPLARDNRTHEPGHAGDDYGSRKRAQVENVRGNLDQA